MRRPPPGVRLRPYADGDQALYAELFSDPAIWTLAGTPRTPAEAAALAERALAAQQDPAGRFRHAVVESDEGSLGLVGLALLEGEWRGGEAEIGVLLRPHAQGQGVGPMALRAMEIEAFDVLGVAALRTRHARDNRPIERVMGALRYLPLADVPGDPQPRRWRKAAPARGTLACIGVGMMLGAHLTPRARGHLEGADVVFALVSDALVEHWLATIHPGVRSLQAHYADGKPRPQAYREMVEAMLAEVRAGRRVVGAFYGHPGVFAGVPHAAIAAARADGFDAVMEPGVSAEDCLYADLGLDPGTHGCAHYEATQLLIEDRRIDVHALLVVWQVGLAGDRSYAVRESTVAQRRRLVERLRRDYPADHPVILYEAATLPIGGPRIETVPLAALAEAAMGMATTAVLAPVGPAPRASAAGAC
ncbi:MAG: GNAT family N-acetyltransferase [Lysobacteraceae bacterium]